jgi:hypothetical protein
MKKSIIIVFILFSTFSFSQWNSEFDYFTLKFGAVHSLLDAQPEFLEHKMLEINGDHYQLTPSSSYLGYVPGYYGSFLYNHDLQNDNVGLSVGLEYKMYGISAKYETVSGNSLIENHKVSQVSIPFFIKYGKQFYEPQRFIYFGAAYNYNLMLSKTQKVDFTETAINTELSNDRLNKSNISAFVGFNYMFFHIQAEYVFGNFLSKNYQETFNDGNSVKLYNGQPQNIILIKTGMAFPINSWTSRKWYAIETWVRRLLK